LTKLGLLLATCGYVGHVPLAPGTAGTLVGVAVFYGLRAFGGPVAEPTAIVILFAVGVWASGVAERHWQRTDPGPVVIDEVVGTLLTLLWLPLTGLGVFVGFLVFRVLDVVKPWPADRFESLHGGLGVMADDAMAGVYGHLLLRLMIALAPAGWLV
jgi:phosphatidylglycerophosphatase A